MTSMMPASAAAFWAPVDVGREVSKRWPEVDKGRGDEGDESRTLHSPAFVVKLSLVQVRPESQYSTGTLAPSTSAAGGTYL